MFGFGSHSVVSKFHLTMSVLSRAAPLLIQRGQFVSIFKVILVKVVAEFLVSILKNHLNSRTDSRKKTTKKMKLDLLKITGDILLVL